MKRNYIQPDIELIPIKVKEPMMEVLSDVNFHGEAGGWSGGIDEDDDFGGRVGGDDPFTDDGHHYCNPWDG